MKHKHLRILSTFLDCWHIALILCALLATDSQFETETLHTKAITRSIDGNCGLANKQQESINWESPVQFTGTRVHWDLCALGLLIFYLLYVDQAVCTNTSSRWIQNQTAAHLPVRQCIEYFLALCSGWSGFQIALPKFRIVQWCSELYFTISISGCPALHHFLTHM